VSDTVWGNTPPSWSTKTRMASAAPLADAANRSTRALARVRFDAPVEPVFPWYHADDEGVVGWHPGRVRSRYKIHAAHAGLRGEGDELSVSFGDVASTAG